MKHKRSLFKKLHVGATVPGEKKLFCFDQIPVLRYYANSADPVQTPHLAASELGLYCCLQKI